jgi:hypothetical protein
MKTGNTTLGLIQMNDPRENMFTLHDIENYEDIADRIGLVVFNALEIQKKMNDVLELVNKLKNN